MPLLYQRLRRTVTDVVHLTFHLLPSANYAEKQFSFLCSVKILCRYLKKNIHWKKLSDFLSWSPGLHISLAGGGYVCHSLQPPISKWTHYTRGMSTSVALQGNLCVGCPISAATSDIWGCPTSAASWASPDIHCLDFNASSLLHLVASSVLVVSTFLS